MDTMTDDLLLLTTDDRPAGRIATVSFNNPDKRNALGREGKKRLIEMLNELSRDDELRVVVLTGVGDTAFVGGADLSEMTAYDPARGYAAATITHLTCQAVRDVPVPVIARINGYCFGFGMELAAACDLRVAVDDAKLGMPETRFGIPSGMEACLLPMLVGWGKARELVLTGDHIGAAEAYRIGFLERIAPRDGLDAAVEGWIDSILKCGPVVTRAQKTLVQDWEKLSVSDSIEAGIRAFARSFETDEPKRMIEAFLNRRKARHG